MTNDIQAFDRQTDLSAPKASPASLLLRRSLPILLVLVVGTLLAASLIWAKLAVQNGAAPLPFLAISLLASGTILLLISLFTGQGSAITARVAEYGLASGLLFLLPNALGFMAVRYVGAGFLSLTFLFPLLVTYCLALLIGMEKFQSRRAIAVLIGLAGGVVLAASKVQLNDAPIIWIALTLCAPLIIAMGNLYRTLRWPKGVAPLFLASMMLLCAGILTLVPVALLDGVGGLSALIGDTLLPVLLAQIITFSALYYLYFILQKVAGPVYLSQIGSVAAVVGAAIATFVLGESMPPNLLIAILLVGVGIFLFQRRTRKR